MTESSAEKGLVRWDRGFLRVLDQRLADGGARAGSRLACRLGCTECCQGPFPINRLDVWRLRRGLERLAAMDPGRAAAVRARARDAVAAMSASFPGDPKTGRLSEDEAAQDGFLVRFAAMPCPALDPATGGCELYADRPVSCRTYGPPVRLGTEDLPPCRLCFVGASASEIEGGRIEPDPDGAEDAVLAALERLQGVDGSTIIAFALA